MSGRRANLLAAFALVVFAAALRLLPHPANFAPVMAVAIFGGAVLPRKLAIWMPLAVLAATDVIIGFYNVMPVVWACYVVAALISSVWLRRPSLVKGAATTFGASALFFIITNFAVWVASGMYGQTWQGLAQCYYMALPFWRNSLVSDMFYTALLFGIFALAQKIVLERAEPKGAGA